MDQLWACEPEYLKMYVEKVLRADKEIVQAAIAFFADRGTPGRELLTIAGDTAIIDIRGTLTNEPCCISCFLNFFETSYGDIQEAIKTIAANDAVKNVRLVIDSPGGVVTGLDETWMALRELAKTRNVVAENHGIMASGAYWLATAADKIVATSPAAETGSIGVRVLIIDFSKMDARLGIKEIHIVSKNAPDKVADAATKEGLTVWQERLDALERVFISRVSTGRNVSIETVEKTFGRGGLLIAQDPDASKSSALSVGMIDGVLGIAATGKDKDSREASEQVDNGGKRVEKEEDSDGNDATAADSDSNGKVEKMKLADVGKKDPALQAEIDARVAAAVAEAKKPTPTPAVPPVAPASASEPAKSSGPSAAALKALEGDSGSYIKSLAAKVLKGEATEAELTAAQAAIDANEEAHKNELAAGETDKQGNTPPAPPASGTEGGEIKSEDDFQSQIARTRGLQGQKETK